MKKILLIILICIVDANAQKQENKDRVYYVGVPEIDNYNSEFSKYGIPAIIFVRIDGNEKYENDIFRFSRLTPRVPWAGNWNPIKKGNKITKWENKNKPDSKYKNISDRYVNIPKNVFSLIYNSSNIAEIGNCIFEPIFPVKQTGYWTLDKYLYVYLSNQLSSSHEREKKIAQRFININNEDMKLSDCFKKYLSTFTDAVTNIWYIDELNIIIIESTKNIDSLLTETSQPG